MTMAHVARRIRNRKLASDPTPQHKKWAHELWERRHDHDFHSSEMRCDEELVVLGLARRGLDPDYPEDGEKWLYGPVQAKE